MGTENWRPVPGDRPVTVLVPVVLFRAEVSADGTQVRGRTERGQLMLAAVAWLDEESRERVEKVLRSSRASGEEAEDDTA